MSFEIEKGEGFKLIGSRLSQESLIKSIAVFKTYALLTGNARKFLPGRYELSPSMSVPEIIATLTRGGRSDVFVTIPEGSTVKDIDLTLSEAGVIEKGSVASFSFEHLRGDYAFLGTVSSLEGFLFPDSYYFDRDSDAETIVRRMLDTFSEKAWTLLSSDRSWYEKLILASFLEREVPEFGDRQIVAGILEKRIGIDMPLQVDATITYIKCEGRIKDCEDPVARKSDFQIPSPYNTYERLGYTPTPISNPGAAAIRAAVSPVETPYLYYLSASETKETHFSRTLEEHNANRFKYL